jgi:sulfate adenylyltransferase
VDAVAAAPPSPADGSRDALEAWTFPDVAAELARHGTSARARGVTVFFTGLSGSGKSTIANALRVRLLEDGCRTVTLLDGDLVRTHLSSELGFSREHRTLNVRRIAFVAAEITRHGGVATLPEFTGVSDPYDVPDDADVTIDTSQVTVPQAVDTLMAALDARGLLEPASR